MAVNPLLARIPAQSRKTRIPGRGHSSPILKNDKVFVTTSYPSSSAALVAQTLVLLRLLLSAVLFGGVLLIAVTDSGMFLILKFLRSSALLFCASAIVILSIYDANLFDYAKCPI